MAALKLTGFSGIYPRTAERALAEMAAVVAENVNLTSGEIRPLRQPLLVHSAVSPVTAYRAVQNDVEKWRTWGTRVHVAKGPLPVDVEARYYWTGDGEPRYARFTNFGTTDYALGVPTPHGALTVSHAGGTGSTVTRFYRHTFFSVDGEESAPSAVSAESVGPIDATWTVSGMSPFPANSGTITGTYAAGVTTFNNTSDHWLRAGEDVVLGTETVEVRATPGLTTFTVAGDYSAVTTWERKAHWNVAGMTRRLYRTAGTTGTWELVADNITATTYVDTLSDLDILGDELISEFWVPPPAKLRGLGVLPSGAAYGYVNNLLCFSEPTQLHAWPEAYQLQADHEIVGAAAYGTVVVAATRSKPHMADGVDPASASMSRVDSVWPCLSEESVVSVGDAVMYATSAGLAMIGLGGASLFTQSFFTEVEWKQRKPATMWSAFSENRLFVRWLDDSAVSHLMLFKMNEPAPLTTSSVQCNGLYVDPLDGELYVLTETGVHRFDAEDGPRIPFEWWSKSFEVPTPLNLGAARIELRSVLTPADAAATEVLRNAQIAANAALITAYRGGGSFNGSAVNTGFFNFGPRLGDVVDFDREYLDFELYVDETLVYSTSLLETTAFKMTSGFLSDNFSVRLRGNVRVLNVKLAETMKGLATV